MKKFRKEKYIKQRFYITTKTWAFQVSFEYYDLDGSKQQYNKTFNESDYTSTKEALDAACKHRDEMRHKLNTEGLPKSKDVTLKEVYENSKNLFKFRVETIRKKDLRFKKYLGHIENKNINKITSLDIQMTLNNMVSNCSNGVISAVFTIWKDIFKAARIYKYVQINLTEEVILPKSELLIKKKNVTTNLATLNDIIHALRKRTKNSDKYIFNTEILIYGLKIMYYTGLRPAEVFALKRSNIDFTNDIILVDDEIGSSYTEAKTIRLTKTELSTRTIPIVKELKNILINLMEFQDASSNLLLVDWDGNLVDTTIFGNKIYYVCRKENLQFNMYRLRHQFSTDLITSNTDPRTVMELMGHNNIAMTIEYARSNDEIKKETLKNRKLS